MVRVAGLVFLACALVSGNAVGSEDAFEGSRWSAPNLVWERDSSITITIGPDDALFCKLEDPAGVLEATGFGPCKLNISRVNDAHQGIWKVSLGQPGKIVLEEQQFLVTVSAALSKKPVVTKNFYKEDTTFVLSCGVQSREPVKMCKFRDPHGKVYISNQDIKEDRFETFTETASALTPEHTCGLKINNIVATDMGLWRCAIETEKENYYAFLAVQCGKMMQDPAIAATVLMKPVPSSPRLSTTAVAGDDVTMSCIASAPLRYCYFRSKNGTIFNVAPGYSSSEKVQYQGAGLDTGECGIKFPAQVADTGAWSCHLGFFVLFKQEKNLKLELTVEEQLVVDQYVSGKTLVVEGKVHNSRPLDYCRFIRMDGYGMTSDRTWLPAGYESISSPSTGYCALHVANPTILDHHPWTVVAKFKDQDLEVTSVTAHTIEVPDKGSNAGGRFWSWTWFMVALSVITVLIIGFLLIPKRNRNWTKVKMTSIRDSFRKTEEIKVPEHHHHERRVPEFFVTESGEKVSKELALGA